ncbi:MAG: hypothetical protein WCA35_17130 [Kovacikia sp.]
MKMRIMSAFGIAALVLGASLSASAQTAETPVLPDETITGVPSQKLPIYPVLTSRFSLPIDVRIAKDTSITTDTPITDQYAKDLTKWSELVRESLKSKPVLVRVVGSETVPFIVNGSEGKIKLNANDKPVYPL